MFVLMAVMTWTMVAIADPKAIVTADEPDYNSIEYGGVWKQEAKLQEEPTEVVQFAISYIGKRWTVLSDDVKRILQEKSYKISGMRILALLFTLDDHQPTAQDVPVYSSNPSGMVLSSFPIIMGHTYVFTVEWMSKRIGLQTHHFTVTEYPESKLYMFSHSSPSLHNFLNVSQMASPVQTTSAQQEEKDHSLYSETNSFASFGTAESDGNIVEKTGVSARSFTPKRVCFPKKEQCDRAPFWDVEELAPPVRNVLPSISLRVMSYNVWNYNGIPDKLPYDKRLQKLAQVCLEAAPDILGFQEVRFGASSPSKRLGPNQVEHLTNLLPDFQFVFQPAQLFENSMKTGRNEEGVAIFSKYPIISTDYILLFRNMSNSADRHQRVCLHAEILLPGVGVIHVYNTHLSLSHEAREASVKQIWEFIQRRAGPAIFLGDLNAEPREKAIRYFREETSLQDSWDLASKEDPGFTFSALKQEPWKRIDYIYVRKDSQTKVKTVEVLQERKIPMVVASDHYPLLATIDIMKQ